MSYNALPYGTYSTVNYQTVDFTVFNRNALLIIKALSILTIIVSSVILLSYALISIVPFIAAIITLIIGFIFSEMFVFSIVGCVLFYYSFPRGETNV